MLQFRVTLKDGFVLADLFGLVSVEAWEKVLHEVSQAIAPTGRDRLVMDLTGLVGWLGIPERQAVGGLMAQHFAAMKKVALFIQPEKIKGVVATEARRLGLDLVMFSDLDEATQWAVAADDAPAGSRAPITALPGAAAGTPA
jgi:hypothetical protein